MLAALFSFFRRPDWASAPFDGLRRACIEGDEAARRAFIDRYQGVVWRAVRARLPRASAQDQEEVVADTFIALLRDDADLLGRYDALKGLSPEGYIRRQARLQANNRARSQRAHKRSQEILSPAGDPLTEHSHPDPGADPERAFLDGEDLGDLLRALERRLTPAIRLTFEMLFVHELDAPEAAQALGCTLDNLYTRKRRLVAALEELLEERRALAQEPR